MKFEIFPKVFAAHQKTTFTLTAVGRVELPKHLQLMYIREDGADPDGKYFLKLGPHGNEYPELPCRRVSDREIEFDLCANGEYEHYIMPYLVDEAGMWSIREKISLFSAEPDLYALRPWKGDFHMHSCRSDGAHAPCEVAACCRRKGCDFMALTDHHQYQPSLDAVAAMEKLPTEMRCYPGEEIHAGRVHVVNFGGSFSVNDFYRDNAEEFGNLVASIAAVLPDELNDHDREQIAIAEAVFKKIGDADGVSIYCHPYWRVANDRFFITRPICDLVMLRRNYDAMEVIAGFNRYEWEQNALNVAGWERMCGLGIKIPAVGVSDAHDYAPDSPRFAAFDWYNTIVFAPDCEFTSLSAAIRAGKSLAYERLPGGEPRLVGEFRYVKYGYFLLREYFPEHDRLCRIEGDRLGDAVSGNHPETAALLTRDRYKVTEWRDRFFA